MGQVDVEEEVKGQNLVRMNLIVKRIESELDQLKNLINAQIHGLTTASPSTNFDGDSDSDGNCDTSISIAIADDESYCPLDTIKIEAPIDSTAEDVDKVSNSNSNYQYEFNNEDQEIDCQNRLSNEDELILGGLDEDEVDLEQSSSYFTSFQNQDNSFQISNKNLEGLILEVAGKNDEKLNQKVIVQMGVRCDKPSPLILHSNLEVDQKSKISYCKIASHLPNAKTIKFHRVERPFKCTICSKSFIKNSHLIRHNFVHSGEKPFSCSLCSKSFTQTEHRNRHILTVHKGDEKPFSCSICSKSFALKQYLNRHMLIHTADKSAGFVKKSHICSICSKSFSSPSYLTLHMRIHTGEPTFKCKICSKSFSLMGNLRKHYLVHTGEKSFSCSVCSRSFAQKQVLNRHMRIHTGEKPYSCSICSETFIQSSHLIYHHKRTHT